MTISDRSRLTYTTGALLLTAGVLLICLLPLNGDPAAASAHAVRSVLLAVCAGLAVSFLPSRAGREPLTGKLLLRAGLAGLAAGFGLVYALLAFGQDGMHTMTALAFVPALTACAGLAGRKEKPNRARLLCLIPMLAGAAVFCVRSVFIPEALWAVLLLAAALMPRELAGSAGGRTVLRLTLPFAAVSAAAYAFITYRAFPVSLPENVLGWAAPVCAGAGYALMRLSPVKKEDSLWLRAAVPLVPLLFFSLITDREPVLATCFLLPACAALLRRLTHRPVRYKAGEEWRLIRDTVPVSFYNGVLCLRHPFHRFTSAASFCFILLNSNRGSDRRYHANVNTLRHEYGHILQAKALGPFRYWRYVAFPSMNGYINKVPYADYYNQPWERGADALGGVKRAMHAPGSEEEWERYFVRALPKRKRAQYIKKERNTMIKFLSDYQEGACPEIMAALQATNFEQSEGYGEDAHCAHARELIRAACGRADADVQFLIGGTSCNKIVISAALRPFEGVLCVETAHINAHETGTIEASGHKVIALPSPDGKLTAQQVEATMAAHWADATHEHIVRPGIVYITYPTEGGLLYTLEELTAIRRACDKWGLFLYLDGARLGYGLAAEGADVTLPDIARLTDAFYIGGTKVGALFGEATVLLHPALKKDFRYMIKNQGGLLAKGRLQGVQFETLFTDGLYQRISAHAVQQAMRIKAVLAEKGIPTLYDSPTNQQFPMLTPAQFDALAEKYAFESWGPDVNGLKPVRFCTSWATRPEHVDALIADIRAL